MILDGVADMEAYIRQQSAADYERNLRAWTFNNFVRKDKPAAVEPPKPVTPPVDRNEHIWNMLVLAAKSSRE